MPNLFDENKLSIEQVTFLNILKDFLNANSSQYNNMIDWNEIKKYADCHQVSAIFYHQTKNELFQQAFAFQLFRSTNYRNAIQNLKAVLKNNRYILVKGAVVAALYPVPELRSMGDVDVLVASSDLENVRDLLLSSGYKFLTEGSGLGEWKYSKNGCIFEIHDTLVHRYDGKEMLVEYFAHVWDYIQEGDLDWSFHLLYLIEHLRQHFVGHGVGFRQFMDIAVVCKKCAIDWNFLECELIKLNLLDFSLTIFAFIDKWFEISVPLKSINLTEEFYLSATKKIFKDGVFGFNNESNMETNLSFKMYYRGIDFNTARREYIWKALFPSYRNMCTLPYCSYVKISKGLLPIAWMHRFLYRSMNKRSRNNIKHQLSEEQVMARIDMLKQWGLESGNGLVFKEHPNTE